MVGDGGGMERSPDPKKMCQLLRPFQRFAGGVFFFVCIPVQIFSAFRWFQLQRSRMLSLDLFFALKTLFFCSQTFGTGDGGGCKLQFTRHEKKNQCKLPKAGSGFLLLS